jgi:AAA+ ATPase superfamily predicted ATPase
MEEAKYFNPFVLTGYYSAEYFCDREKETDLLISHSINGVNTTLLSVRRMGKTGLLKHTIAQLQQKKKGIGIYIDIFDTENLRDFTNRLISSILEAFPEKDPLWKKIMDFIKQLRPVISYDELSGKPSITFDYVQAKQYETSLDQIFKFLDKQNKNIVLAIDEFQQVTNYPEKNIESILRTQIQQLKQVRFIFSGSSPHLLNQMFYQVKRPFFASTQSVELHEINENVYKTFITVKFQKYKRKIDNESLSFIADFTRLHTFYTQALCNKIFSGGEKKINLKICQKSAYELLKQNESVYYQYRNLLTANQWAMLKAIAIEVKLYTPNSKNIIQKHKLGSSSLVKRSLDALLEKEMVYQSEDEKGKYYVVYDCFFSRWLEMKNR